MYIFMDLFLLKSGGQTEMTYLMQSFGCFCCLNMEMWKFFNCQDEQGA